MNITEENSIEVFKTSVLKEEEARILSNVLSNAYPFSDIHFDLEDCDKILRVEGSGFTAQGIVTILNRYGYLCVCLQ